MHFLPIAQRELLVAARRPRTYRSRTAAGGLTLAFGLYFAWVFTRVVGGPEVGRRVFENLSQFAFIYCLFAGASNTADSLSREKREGTIGLLFLTRLRSYDIVLGKLLATSLPTIYSLLASVPVFAICLLAGGLRAGDFWRTMLGMFNTLFLSMAIGLAVSAVSRQERRATQTAAGVMVFSGFLLPLLGEYLRTKTTAVELGWWLRVLSPSQLLLSSTIPTAGVRDFWWSLAMLHGLSWILLGIASAALRFSWQDQVPKPRTQPWRDRFHDWAFARGHARDGVRRARLEVNPFYFLAARNRWLELEAWSMIVGVVLLAAWASWFFRGVLPLFIFCITTGIILQAMIKMQVAGAACDRLAAEKHEGTLELILATPLSVRRIIDGQWLAIGRQLLAPLLTVAAITFGLLFVVLAWRDPDFLRDSEAAQNCRLVFIAATAMLAADAVALGWVGMWQALSAKQALQARSRTLFAILFLPWVVLLLLISLAAVGSVTGWLPSMRDLPFEYFLGGWFVFGLVNDLAWACWARSRLCNRFRRMATERFQTEQAPLFWR